MYDILVNGQNEMNIDEQNEISAVNRRTYEVCSFILNQTAP